MPRSVHTPLDPCPFVDDEHPGCAGHLTLAHLRDALTVCVDGYRACPNYWRLARADPQRLIRLTTLTCHGQPFQPTGS